MQFIRFQKAPRSQKSSKTSSSRTLFWANWKLIALIGIILLAITGVALQKYFFSSGSKLFNELMPSKIHTVPNPSEARKIIQAANLIKLNPELAKIEWLADRDLTKPACIQIEAGDLEYIPLSTSWSVQISGTLSGTVNKQDPIYGKIVCFTPVRIKEFIEKWGDIGLLVSGKLLSSWVVPVDPKNKSMTLQFIDNLNIAIALQKDLWNLSKQADILAQSSTGSTWPKLYELSRERKFWEYNEFVKRNCTSEKICPKTSFEIQGKLEGSSLDSMKIQILFGSGWILQNPDGSFVVKGTAYQYSQVQIEILDNGESISLQEFPMLGTEFNWFAYKVTAKK